MRIRKAREEDIETLQEIARRVIRNNYTSFLGQDNVSQFIDSGLSDKEIVEGVPYCHIMQQGDTIVGFAVVMDDLLYLIMVDVPFQHTGYGAALLAYVEREMFVHHSVLKLQTFAGNTDNIRFYEKHGWTVAREEVVKEMGMVMLHMEKKARTGQPAQAMEPKQKKSENRR